MKAVLIHETGGPDVLSYEETERPEPGEGEVLIAVRAASVNPIDWKIRRGLRETQLPKILGNDVSGVVEVSRAEDFVEGDEVFGIAPSGGYAQFATAPGAMIAKKPAGMSHEQAAALPVAGMTAWQALFDRGGLQEGQSALVAGGAGGVGHLAVQFAKHVGARVLATGSSRNREFVMGLGADEYIDYTSQDIGERAKDVDVAFDTVGGETTESLLPALRAGGVLVTIANAPPEQAAAERGARAELLVMSPSSELLARIARLLTEGEVRVEIARTFPLGQARQAHELSEAGHTRGKIILVASD
ncbi:MAG TPA: NADP-dependent oxidoreductase [Solirubrobacteraceae bacterium]|jgi:NADPH:quinone reductase-like Zn-dependent oxidoreductase|nr:NADP-dependent oxidoreductase [Solirubrobacteraceae bacterium]